MMTFEGKSERVHAHLWRKLRGAVPDGEEIDHMYRDRLDARLRHLHTVQHGTNMRNTPQQREV